MGPRTLHRLAAISLSALCVIYLGLFALIGLNYAGPAVANHYGYSSGTCLLTNTVAQCCDGSQPKQTKPIMNGCPPKRIPGGFPAKECFQVVADVTIASVDGCTSGRPENASVKEVVMTTPEGMQAQLSAQQMNDTKVPCWFQPGQPNKTLTTNNPFWTYTTSGKTTGPTHFHWSYTMAKNIETSALGLAVVLLVVLFAFHLPLSISLLRCFKHDSVFGIDDSVYVAIQ